MSVFSMVASGTTEHPPGRLREESPQQEAFWAELITGESHVILEARAGTGKSSSCREGMHRIRDANQGQPPTCSYVAFNRSIAAEFGEGLPPGATATTMHSAGFAALRRHDPSIGDPAKFKMYDIVDSFLPRRDKQSRKIKTAAVKLANLCKSHLIGHDGESAFRGLDHDIMDRLCAAHGIDARGFRLQLGDLVPRMLERCITRKQIVDFGDMIWLPVILGLDFPPVDYLFVDEAQDLDPCQHALVRQIVGEGRMVVTGDPWQAIYAFRGADSASMATLGSQLDASWRGLTRLPLTMTRRCPSSHVELAARIVGDFEALPEAPKGKVTINASTAECLTPGVLALCRTNAPLVAKALSLACANVPVGIQGKDLGEGLAKFVESFDVASTGDLMRRVEEYRVAETDRLVALENTEGEIEAMNDRCGCVIALSQGLDTPGQVASKIARLFVEATPAMRPHMVLLSSIHRAKGRESDRVAILEPESMPHSMAKTDEAFRQELNLIYVAGTRSKDELSFCGMLPSPLMPRTGA